MSAARSLSVGLVACVVGCVARPQGGMPTQPVDFAGQAARAALHASPFTLLRTVSGQQAEVVATSNSLRPRARTAARGFAVCGLNTAVRLSFEPVRGQAHVAAAWDDKAPLGNCDLLMAAHYFLLPCDTPAVGSDAAFSLCPKRHDGYVPEAPCGRAACCGPMRVKASQIEAQLGGLPLAQRLAMRHL